MMLDLCGRAAVAFLQLSNLSESPVPAQVCSGVLGQIPPRHCSGVRTPEQELLRGPAGELSQSNTCPICIESIADSEDNNSSPSWSVRGFPD